MELAVKWLSLLHEPDAIIEIRSIDPKPIVSGYFRADSPHIAAELAKYPNRTFYQSLNHVKSACYARAQHERLVERPKETTSDNDIIGFQLMQTQSAQAVSVHRQKRRKQHTLLLERQ